MQGEIKQNIKILVQSYVHVPTEGNVRLQIKVSQLLMCDSNHRYQELEERERERERKKNTDRHKQTGKQVYTHT